MRTMVYVDGFNLYYSALKIRPHCKWVNPIKLCEHIWGEPPWAKARGLPAEGQ